jgi:hypothetical protein
LSGGGRKRVNFLHLVDLICIFNRLVTKKPTDFPAFESEKNEISRSCLCLVCSWVRGRECCRRRH